LSGEAGELPNTIVFITGDQNISGQKTFTSRPTVSGIGILLSGEAYSIKDVYYYTGNNFTPDAFLGRTFEYVLTGNVGASASLNTPTNMNDGDNIIIKIKQSASGANNMQFSPSFKFPGSVYPSLTLEPNRVDIYTILKINNSFYSTYVKDFSE
jgi:hypothetical protein